MAEHFKSAAANVLSTVKTYESMTLEELEENEDEFGEDDEAAIEMYRWVDALMLHTSLCESVGSRVSLQTEASCRVESSSGEERFRGGGRNLRAGLRQGGQQGWRWHLGGSPSLQTGVGHPTHEVVAQVSSCSERMFSFVTSECYVEGCRV